MEYQSHIEDDSHLWALYSSDIAIHTFVNDFTLKSSMGIQLAFEPDPFQNVLTRQSREREA